MPSINKSFVKKLEPSAVKPKFYWDEGDESIKGFGVRVSGTTKTFILQAYELNKATGRKTQKRIKLGTHPEMTAEEARKRAGEWKVELSQGRNPKAARNSNLVSLREIFMAYRQARQADGGLRPKTISVYTSALERCFPDWLDRPAVAITKEMVLERFREIATSTGVRSSTNGARAQAAQAFRVLKALLNFAQENYENADGQPLIQANPVDRLSKTHRGWSRVPARTDVIEPADLEAWYRSVMRLSNETTRDFILLCLFTGLRRGAAQKLKWEHLSLKSKTIMIPASDDKTHKVQKLPMSDFVHDLLQRRKDHPLVDLIYVFPGDKPGQFLQEPKRAISKVVDLSGVKFSCHTLRRTFATTAERLDISYYKVKQLLNHAVSGDVTGHHYVQIDVEQLREPMERISSYFIEQMRPANTRRGRRAAVK